MNAPRLEIDLAKISHNTVTLVERLAEQGISVTAVTKATLGSAKVANVLLQAGVSSLGDSRIENIEALRIAEVPASMTLIRAPMLSQADRVVARADVSFNTELDVLKRLSVCAQAMDKSHGVVLMVELGDLREGIMPSELEHVVQETLSLPSIELRGIATNLACRSGVAPDATNMGELSALADSIESTFGLSLEVVSGGNSANLAWALSGADTGRINDLRLGEAILLGREPLHRQPIDGLHTDAITLVAEVLESKLKPSEPWGTIGQSAFGGMPQTRQQTCRSNGRIAQTILALGHQDTDPSGTDPPRSIEILGASSDHLVVDSSPNCLPIGSEMRFQLNYSALLRAMTSPFVAKDFKHSDCGELMPNSQTKH